MQKDNTTLPAAITITVGEHWQVTLPGRGAAGYQWIFEYRGEQDLVAVSITPIATEQSPKTGGEPPDSGGVDECVDIHALHPGTTVLYLKQIRTWEKDKEPLQQQQLEVTILA